MRIIIFLLLIFIIIKPVEAQTPSKSQMQSQMKEVINDLNKQIADTEKQLADAKRNKEDTETITDLEEQLKMLKKQVDMMGGLNKNLANMSDKIVQQATEEDPIVPKKDAARINSLPKKIMTETELSLFVKNVNTGVEKLIPTAERTEALNIYNQTKSQYKSTAVVANADQPIFKTGLALDI